MTWSAAEGITSAARTTPVPVRSGLRATIRWTPPVASRASVTASARGSSTARRSLSMLRSRLPELDLADHLRRGARCDHRGRQVLGNDGVGSDHAPLADLDTSRDDATDPEPAVRADPHRAAWVEALPGDRFGRIVVAVIRVAYEAVVGEHHVVPDLDQLGRGEHRVAVQEASLADPDSCLRGERQPAARLEQRPFPDLEPPGVERLEHLTLDRVADEEASLRGVSIEPQAPPPAAIALIPAPLHP